MKSLKYSLVAFFITLFVTFGVTTLSFAQTESSTEQSVFSAQLVQIKSALYSLLSTIQTNSQLGSAAFAVGEMVLTTQAVDVHDANTAEVIGSVPSGQAGQINKGPRTVNGVEMWKINFFKGKDGWVDASALNIITEKPEPEPDSESNSGTETTTATDEESTEGSDSSIKRISDEDKKSKLESDNNSDVEHKKSPKETTQPVSTAFSAGDSVVIDTGDSSRLNVRQSGGKQLGQQTDGMPGLVVDGPRDRIGYMWWLVDFDSGIDGWVVEDFLKNSDGSSPVPTPKPTPSPEPSPNPTPSPNPSPVPSPTPSNGIYKIGESIQVNTGDGSLLNVREPDNGSLVGQQADGSQGSVMTGPTSAGSYNWWEVDFDTGVDGWVAEDFTVAVSTGPAPSPTPNPVPAPNSPTATGVIPDVPFDYEMEPGAVTRTGELPSSLNAGDVLQLSNTEIIDDTTLTCSGTDDNPAFIVGGVITGTGGSASIINVSGSHCHFIDTEFVNAQPRSTGSRHVFSGIEVSENGKNCANIGGIEVVITDSEFHHCRPTGRDAHGIQVSVGSKDIWILDSKSHNNSGNGFQATHCREGCQDTRPSGIYLRGNEFYENREGNGLKWADSVIFEANTFHTYRAARANEEWCFGDGFCGSWNSGSDGAALVIGADNDPEGLTNVHVINNLIYNTSQGLRVESASAPIVIEDNIIQNFGGRCLALDKAGEGIEFRGNTCDGGERGIFQNWRDNFSLDVDDNLFKNLTGPAVEYEQRPVYEASTLTNNVFENTGGVIYGNTSQTTESGINGLVGASGNEVN